jgi:hypothetical protein
MAEIRGVTRKQSERFPLPFWERDRLKIPPKAGVREVLHPPLFLDFIILKRLILKTKGWR